MFQRFISSIQKGLNTPLLLPFDKAKAQFGPSMLSAEKLSSTLLKTILGFTLKIGIPFQIFIGLVIIYNVWIIEKSPPLNFYIHIIGSLLQFGVITYYFNRNPYVGLLAFFALNIIFVNIQTYRTHEPGTFAAIVPVFALPSLLLPTKVTLRIILIHTLLFFIVGYIDPSLLNRSDWKTVLFLTWVIIVGFTTVGVGFRRVVQDYVAAIGAFHVERESYQRAEQLREVEREAREFVSFYNHEVGGLFDTLVHTLRKLRRGDHATAADLWEMVDDATGEINHLLDQMGDLAKKGRIAPLQRESLDSQSLVEQAIANVQVVYPTVRFDTEIVLSSIVGDRTFLLRAIETGIRNAAQAVDGQESAFVLISVFPEAGLFVIRIEDNGLGFAPAILAHMQDSLADLAKLPLGVSTKEDGSGRGLPLMQRVALLHGGTLALGNSDGGAWVEIRFPTR